MSIWRMSRMRVAPSDDRIASSLARSVARANCMFITFTHAMSSTPTQKPSIVSSSAAQRERRERLDQRLDQAGVELLVGVGVGVGEPPGERRELGLAWSSETPGLIRPRTAGADRLRVVPRPHRELAVERDPQLLVDRES